MYSSAPLSELIECTRFEEKFPKTFGSYELRAWITDLESPCDFDAHCFLWHLYETMEARCSSARWNQMSPCIRPFFNPADLAMGKVMSSMSTVGAFGIVFKCADTIELCKQVARLIAG